MTGRNFRERAAVTRPARSISSVYWVLGGVLTMVAIGAWAVVSMFAEREIKGLGFEPITGALQRWTSSSDLSGYCSLETWILSEESLKILRERGLDALAAPRGLEPEFTAAAWRPLSDIDAAKLPWGRRKCPDPYRREMFRLARNKVGFVATARRAPADRAEEHAFFLIALEEGVFARATFSGEALGRLDEPSAPPEN